jgi:putative ABC transport system permease protein
MDITSRVSYYGSDVLHKSDAGLAGVSRRTITKSSYLCYSWAFLLGLWIFIEMLREVGINKEDGKPYTLHIDAVADSYIEQFIYVPIHEFNKKMGLPENSYRGLFSTVKLDIPDEQLSGTKSMNELPAAMDEFMGQMTSMVVLMTIVSSLVALIILYLVTSLIIEENRNTISLFKVFGYRRREIRSLILNSSTLVIVAGFIIGIPVAAASMGAVYGYLGKMINLVLPTIISPLYVAISFAAIMLTYQFSKLLCAKSVETVSMSEALKPGTE